jgi:hypothetical protein
MALLKGVPDTGKPNAVIFSENLNFFSKPFAAIPGERDENYGQNE